MKSFFIIIFFLIGVLLILYAIPETSEFFPDINTGTENPEVNKRLMISPDKEFNIVALIGGSLSWLFASILQMQKIKLQNMEIAEKKANSKKKK